MYTISLTPTANGFANAVTFSLAGLPANSSGSFSPPSFTPGSSVTPTTLTVTTTARPAGSNTGGRPNLPFTGLPANWLILFALILAGLTPFAIRVPLFARVRFGRAGVVVVLLLISGYLAGCASTGFPEGIQGTPAGTYTLTVTGTSGTAAHTTTVTLKVQ